MSKKLDKAVVDIGNVSSLVQSLILLVRFIAQQIRESKGDSERHEAIAADLDASAPVLARAVIANTPAGSDPKLEEEIAAAEPAPKPPAEKKEFKATPKPTFRGRRSTQRSAKP